MSAHVSSVLPPPADCDDALLCELWLDWLLCEDAEDSDDADENVLVEDSLDALLSLEEDGLDGLDWLESLDWLDGLDSELSEDWLLGDDSLLSED
jgi:hypothetical protein